MMVPTKGEWNIIPHLEDEGYNKFCPALTQAGAAVIACRAASPRRQTTSVWVGTSAAIYLQMVHHRNLVIEFCVRALELVALWHATVPPQSDHGSHTPAKTCKSQFNGAVIFQALYDVAHHANMRLTTWTLGLFEKKDRNSQINARRF